MQLTPVRKTSNVRPRMIAVAVASAATLAVSLSAPSAQAASGNVWDRVAACESGGNWSISTGNGYFGGLQFSASSWRAAGGAKYASLPSRATRAQQIEIGKNLLRAQGPHAWPVCGPRAGLTKANGLAADSGITGASAAGASTATVVAKRSTTKAAASGKSSRAKIRTLQSWLGQARTGRWTSVTTRRLQAKVGARVNGVIGRTTVRRTEAFVKAKRTNLSYFSTASMRALLAYAATH